MKETRAQVIERLERQVRAFLYGSSYPCLNLKRRDIAEAYADGTLKLSIEKRHIEVTEQIITEQQRLLRDNQARERVLVEALAAIKQASGCAMDYGDNTDVAQKCYVTSTETLARINSGDWMAEQTLAAIEADGKE